MIAFENKYYNCPDKYSSKQAILLKTLKYCYDHCGNECYVGGFMTQNVTS